MPRHLKLILICGLVTQPVWHVKNWGTFKRCWQEASW